MVILYQKAQGTFLDIVLRYFTGLLQFCADFLDGGRVDASYLPGQFPHHTVLSLDHLRIEAIGNRPGILGIHDTGIVFLHIFPRDALVVIDGR